MFSRLWWKEARQTWPIWVFLACTGLALQGLIRYLAGPRPVDGVALTAALATFIYLFLVTAAAFAGERESGTLGMLDVMAVDRPRLWAAKATFALATTAALGIVLGLTAIGVVGVASPFETASSVTPILTMSTGAALWLVVALGWGLFWSAVLGNALHAALLAMASLAATGPIVNVQEVTRIDATLILLPIAAVTTAASAVVFVRGGPPRWERRRRRPAARIVERSAATAILASGGAPPRFWHHAVGRLAWESFREARADLRWFLAATVVVFWPYHVESTQGTILPGFPLVGVGVIGLIAGVSTFNRENREKTHRFLFQHGARSGVVWAVKVLIWGAVTAALGALILTPYLWRAWNYPKFPPSFVGGVLGSLTIPFAVGALCGMVFRRAILAATIAVVATLLLYGLLSLPIAMGLIPPYAPPCLAIAVLAVTWAWSGDWLRYEPGLAKWGRLAAWCSLATAVVVPGYIVDRVWSVQPLSKAETMQLFQTDRFLHPIPPNENAAPLYREADKAVARLGGPILESKNAPRWPFDVRDPAALEFDVTEPGVVAWLEKLEPTLAILRKAARSPYCRFEDLRKATIFDAPVLPALTHLTTPLAISAEACLARGDLDGSWREIETMLRMARQFSTVRGTSHSYVESLAVGLAFRWAADPRQTAASLKQAIAAYRSLPMGFTPADRSRVYRIVFQNTLDLPRHEIVERALRIDGGYHKPTIMDVLQASLLTLPWEKARSRRAYDRVAGSWIAMLGDASYLKPPQPPGFGMLHEWRAFRPEMYRSSYLQDLVETTPTIKYAEPGADLDWTPRRETERRALEIVLELRFHQTRHDGELPDFLEDLLLETPGSVPPSSLIDPFSGLAFGYIRSSGQALLPLEDVLYRDRVTEGRTTLQKPSGDSRLLYSIGPDLVNEYARRDLDRYQSGDLVYPLKNGVKPPKADSP